MTTTDSEVMSIDIIDENEESYQSVEAVRKQSQAQKINVSWEPSFHSFDETKYKDICTPPCVKILVNGMSPVQETYDNSTQTETQDLGISGEDQKLTSSVNTPLSLILDNSEVSFKSKRCRRDSVSNIEDRPSKKSKSTKSSNSSMSDFNEDYKTSSLRASGSSSQLSSGSEASFKSIGSNSSYKYRKRRMKSDSNLFRDVFQRTRKSINLSKPVNSEFNSLGKSLFFDRYL